MGRSKYLSPVYSALQDSDQHDTGVKWFCENIDFYHPVASTTIEGILGVDQSACETKHASKFEKLIDNLDGAVQKFMEGYQLLEKFTQ